MEIFLSIIGLNHLLQDNILLKQERKVTRKFLATFFVLKVSIVCTNMLKDSLG